MVQIGKLITCDRCGKKEIFENVPKDWGEHTLTNGATVNLCPICNKEYGYTQIAFMNQMHNHDIPKELMETVNGKETELNRIPGGLIGHYPTNKPYGGD